jgi:hypothetical protein
MLSDYIEASWRLAQMRATCVGPCLDGFSAALTEAGYSTCTIRVYIRAADHVGRWADRRRIDIASWDDELLGRFGRHLIRCKCKSNKGVFSDALIGVRLLLVHLRAFDAIAAATPTPAPLVVSSRVGEEVAAEETSGPRREARRLMVLSFQRVL